MKKKKSQKKRRRRETKKENAASIDNQQPDRRILNKEPPPLPKRQATFGSNSFSFSPGKITPLNSFNDTNTVLTALNQYLAPLRLLET